MDNTQNLGQPVGKVTTTYNGEKFRSMSMQTVLSSFRMARCARSSRKWSMPSSLRIRP